jgi:hypothetical protein
MRARGRLPPHEVRAVFEDLCHAVAAAHRAGVVHRDLKPANVFWADAQRTGARFTIKVLDFGIAKALARDAVSTIGPARGITRAGLGTPLWMAPEQVRNEPVSPATDVWALGLIAFHLLTGALYWRAASDPDGSAQTLFHEVLVAPFAPASARAAELGASLPDGFDAWFACCVARDPRARFVDADACFRALDPLFGARQAPPPPGPTPPVALGMPAVLGAAPTLAVTVPTPPRARPPWGVLIGAACLVALSAGVAVAALVVARGHAGPDRPADRSPERPGDRPAERPSDRSPAPFVCPGERCIPFQVADPAHVDAIDLLPTARKVARSIDATAELGRISVSPPNDDGTFDTGSRASVLYQFVAKNRIFALQVSGTQFAVVKGAPVVTHSLGDGPFCSAKAARRAAAARVQGMPVLVMNMYDAANTPGAIWQVVSQSVVATMDAHTCAPKGW